MNATRVRIEKDKIVRLVRNLKGRGKILVSPNQEISPSDIIGMGSVSAGFRVINLSRLLKVGPKDVSKYLQRTIGQKIYKGELLAQKKNLFGGKTQIASPTDGLLEFLNPQTGELKMSFLPKNDQLPAGVYGIVEKVDNERGQVLIKTQASIIHGCFGSGRVRDGILEFVGKRDQLIESSLISPIQSGKILVGGSLIFKDTISAAISDSVAGIITGGINAKEYKAMAGGNLVFPKKLDNDVGISLMVCEGFGSVAIGEDIYEVLAGFNGKYVSIDGNRSAMYLPSFASSSMNAVRKTSLPAVETTMSETAQVAALKLGIRVRVVGNSFLGYQGKVVAVDKQPTLLPSSVKTLMVTIETRSRKLQVPVANLEILV